MSNRKSAAGSGAGAGKRRAPAGKSANAGRSRGGGTTPAAAGRARTKPSDAASPALVNGQVGGGGDDDAIWRMRLYVAGQTPKSIAAFANLKRLCEEHLPGRYEIEVIDLVENPQLAQGDQILAIPTLVRKLPEPLKRIIGNLSDAEKFLVGMDLRPQP